MCGGFFYVETIGEDLKMRNKSEIKNKTLYRRDLILYNYYALKLNNRQFVTILSLNKTTGAIEQILSEDSV